MAASRGMAKQRAHELLTNHSSDFVSNLYHHLTGTPTHDEREQMRQQRQVANEQIKAYKEQTELTRQQLDKTRNEENVEKRRIQEKQVRSLRRNYRTQAAGILGVGQPATEDMTNKLGG